jgi:hypothetical protein
MEYVPQRPCELFLTTSTRHKTIHKLVLFE